MQCIILVRVFGHARFDCIDHTKGRQGKVVIEMGNDYGPNLMSCIVALAWVFGVAMLLMVVIMILLAIVTGGKFPIV